MSAPPARRARMAPISIVFMASAAFIALAFSLRWGGTSDGIQPRAVIPPGQEDLVADMVGRGVLLPGGCTFVGGGIDGEVIRTSYRCADGTTLGFELRNAATARLDAPRTARVALLRIDGSPSAEFTNALLARIAQRERELEWQSIDHRPGLRLVPGWVVAALLLLITPLLLTEIGRSEAALIAALSVRSWLSTYAPSTPAARMLASIRVAGLIGVGLVAWRAAGAHGGDVSTFVGVLWVAGFLWLTACGFFGYGDARRSDAVALAPFALALAVRELFTLHSIQALEIQFTSNWSDRHSVVYPLLQKFFTPIVRDQQSFIMHLNGVLGAVAVLPLYLFVRQRTGSRAAGVFCASLLAVHPLIARFAPTDGSYSLLLASWFGGLALLTARRPDARALLGGATLLAIAATCRIEGVTLLLASLFLVDLAALVAAARRHVVAAAASVAVMAALGAVHAAALLPMYLNVPSRPPLIPPFEQLWAAAVWPAAYNDPIFMRLVWLGVLVGLLPRKRLGLFAYVAMLIVLAPCADSEYGVIAHHRLIMACAVQTIVAGMGAYGLVAWLPARTPWRYLKALPVVVAVYIFMQHADELRTRYAFNEEYDMVRSNLVSNGVAPADCVLLTFTSLPSGDSDIHDFSQVVPEMHTVDCVRRDCVREVAESRCAYYVRSAACYWYAPGTRDCGDDCGVTAPCAAFESAVEMERVDVREVELVRSFPDRKANYPPTAAVGLFRVRSIDRRAK